MVRNLLRRLQHSAAAFFGAIQNAAGPFEQEIGPDGQRAPPDRQRAERRRRW